MASYDLLVEYVQASVFFFLTFFVCLFFKHFLLIDLSLLKFDFFCEESLMHDTNLHCKDCSEMHSASCSQVTSSFKCPMLEEEFSPRDRSLAAQPISIRKHNQEKSPQTLAHLVNFSKNMSDMFDDHTIFHKRINLSHVIAAWSAFLALFT